MDVGVIADDLTGAADSGVQFARAGYRTAVIFRGESVPEDVDAAVIDTDSRSVDPREARERVLEAGETLRGARMVYKKLDSTLRGRVAAELAAALEATGRARAVVAPAFPAAGRSTRRGVQMVRGVPVHETELADDPQTPVVQGHIPSLLAEAGLSRIRTLSVEDLEDGASVREAVEGGRWIVADALSDAHLGALVQAVPDPSEVLWAGSAGLASALGGAYPGDRAAASSGETSQVSRALAVVGTTSEVARDQLRRLVAEPGVAEVALDTRAVVAGGSDEAVEEALAAARKALVGGMSVALYSAAEREAREQGAAERIADALAVVVAGLSEACLFEALVMTGGDTAVHVARELGARGILLEEELEPGVPIGTLLGPRPYRVVTKAGGFGTPDTLGDAWRVLARGMKGPDVKKSPMAVTMGDPAGIGPEIIAKTFAEPDMQDMNHAVVVGDAVMMERAVRLLGLPLRINAVSRPEEAAFEEGVIDLISVSELPEDLPFGKLDARAGAAAFEYVRLATELALEGSVRAVATAPLNKEAMHLGGHKYPGHTEILAELTNTKDYAMMLVAEDLRVIHVSTHVSLREAIDRVRPERELAVIRLAHETLRRIGVEEPRVAVAGLNPHAGENRLFGTEDAEIIAPAVEKARGEGIDASGPWPPDTIFARARKGEYDIVVVQYHDQGHVPIKLLGFESGVNVTVGLPFFRTSVDHGTAFDIAGTGKADHTSMRAALELARELAQAPEYERS